MSATVLWYNAVTVVSAVKIEIKENKIQVIQNDKKGINSIPNRKCKVLPPK